MKVKLVGLALVSLSLCAGAEKLSGTVKADGSSTVFPITEAVAEEFGKLNRDVKVTVGISGTGGGFKKFCSGETDFSNASRPIKQAEIDACKANNIEYVEMPVAYDALSVVVNKNNTWMRDITVAELKKLWEPDAQGKIMTWNQVRASWPNEPIKLFGAGTDSGTFDYFTEAIVGKEDLSRGDYTATEDDNVTIKGVSRDNGALGYLGLAYYEENKAAVRAVPIINKEGDKAVMPSKENVKNGTYVPLSRPMFTYVRADALKRPEVKAFVDFYIAQAPTLTNEVGYVALSPSLYQVASQRINSAESGSVFGGQGHKAGISLEALYKAGAN